MLEAFPYFCQPNNFPASRLHFGTRRREGRENEKLILPVRFVHHLRYRGDVIKPAGRQGLMGWKNDVYYTSLGGGMKRTQLYIDEGMARILETLSRQKGITVSELVREGLRERYAPDKEIDKGELARSLVGIWKNRGELKDIRSVVRRLRKGSRLKRFDNV
jgi:hypothetical protein